MQGLYELSSGSLSWRVEVSLSSDINNTVVFTVDSQQWISSLIDPWIHQLLHVQSRAVSILYAVNLRLL